MLRGGGPFGVDVGGGQVIKGGGGGWGAPHRRPRARAPLDDDGARPSSHPPSTQAAAKRYKVTGSGKVMVRRAGKQHLNEKMSRKKNKSLRCAGCRGVGGVRRARATLRAAHSRVVPCVPGLLLPCSKMIPASETHRNLIRGCLPYAGVK